MPAGRPKAKINLDEVRELAAEGNTQEDVAKALHIARSTLCARKEAMEAYQTGLAEMRCSLRHWQIQQAKSGNVSMLIWLGRNMLGQSDAARGDDEGANSALDKLVEALKNATSR